MQQPIHDVQLPINVFYATEYNLNGPGYKRDASESADVSDNTYIDGIVCDEAIKALGTLKQTDKPFFLMLSHYAVHSPLQGKPDKVARYQQVPKDKQQGKPAYAAMVESVDDSVGRVMKTLREEKLDERTLVIFASDNGGAAGSTDNSPLRANKASSYEGGIRVPFIVKWPDRTKPASVSHEPVISTDIYPTILAATGQELRPHQHVDGKNLVPVLTGHGGLDRDAIYWHYPHYCKQPHAFPSTRWNRSALALRRPNCTARASAVAASPCAAGRPSRAPSPAWR